METPIGLIDVHAHHPEKGICYVGLLLLKESHHKCGLGRKSYLLLEDYVRRAFDCSIIRLGVSKENDYSNFWEKMGYTPNGNAYEWVGESKTTLVLEFEKEISP